MVAEIIFSLYVAKEYSKFTILGQTKSKPETLNFLGFDYS